MLNDAEGSIGVTRQEIPKIGPTYKTHLRRLFDLGRSFIGFSAQRFVQAEKLSNMSGACHDTSARCIIGRYPHLPGNNPKYAGTSFPSGKQNHTWQVSAHMPESLKIPQCLRCKSTEDFVYSQTFMSVHTFPQIPPPRKLRASRLAPGRSRVTSASCVRITFWSIIEAVFFLPI